MEPDLPPNPLEYGNTPPSKDKRPPKSFRLGRTRDGDDLPITILKWMIGLAIVGWIVVEILRGEKW